ncbi:glycosyltransferase family 2 protein [Neobacillus jeddahensis]|uniref:glycosyltransferase family 2 protein n=1 Tax=Neobacillus jeddahensis TaxID=1461580 RepID=UPI00058DD4AA|nr:glycosyltransferase family 2 protein [Neobacillus jeddahensis]
MEKVDILLPIYNSYEETKNCIESIYQCTSIEAFDLYLLDDKSPDDHIQELTAYYSDKYSNIISIRNEKNLGFPGNVNNGFAVSKRDAIILNSDTMVTEGWLETLAQVATSDEKIAAVIPMSNYGIISGIPTSNSEINDLFSFKELVLAFNKSKRDGFVEAPLLIGFCMYVKRSALEQVGVFDAETFKRGYGEESDWCMRARIAGYKLVVAKGAYVHHIGGVSFGAEKELLRKRSKEILLQRYPEIDVELEQFVRKGHSLKDIRKNVMKNLPFLRTKASKRLKLKMIKHYLTHSI